MKASGTIVLVAEVWEEGAFSEGVAKARKVIRLGPCMACIL